MLGVRYAAATHPAREHHLDSRDEEDGTHGDSASHGGVVLVPKGGQTGVGERDEGGREQMHEGGGDEDAGAEVACAEEEGGGDSEAGEFFGDNGKGTCCGGGD